MQRDDIRRNAVTGAKVKNESLTGKDVKGLTGAIRRSAPSTGCSRAAET